MFSGALSPLWKGGKTKDKRGYIILRSVGGGTMLEHRQVMQDSIGRELLPDETVHHRNGLRGDNRIENLELKASSHGVGQSVPDLVEWAKEILSRYQPQSLSNV